MADQVGRKPAATDSSDQSLPQLRERFDQLNKRKIQIQTKRDDAIKRRDELMRRAKQEYGTDQVSELRQILSDMKQANEKKRLQYQNDLDRIEQTLAAIDAEFAEAELDQEEDGTH